MNAVAVDEIGIRGTSGNNLAYTNGQSSFWFGSGIIDKPIDDFLSAPNRLWLNNLVYSLGYNVWDDYGGGLLTPYFSTSDNIIRVHSSYIILEPAEYALVFGLFALGFFFFRHRFQKKELRNER